MKEKKPVGRPTRYADDGSIAGCACLLSLDVSAIAGTPVVYGIGSKQTGEIVYVGKSIHPQRRFEAYRSSTGCHNKLLSEWLLNHKNDVFVEVLHIGAEGMDAAETLQIKKLGKRLFNVMSGGEQSWRNHVTKPWMAGIGVHCPSSLALKMRGKEIDCDFVRSLRDGMTVVDRIKFEVSIAMDMMALGPLHKVRPYVSKWLDRCEERMIAALESSLTTTFLVGA